MMLYRSPKVKVRLQDGDRDFFDINAWVLQGETLALYLLIKNGFQFKKKVKSKQYPTEIITDAVNADDMALLANTPTQAESLLHTL